MYIDAGQTCVDEERADAAGEQRRVGNDLASQSEALADAACEETCFDEESNVAAKVLASPSSQHVDAAERRSNRSPLAQGIRQAFMYYGVSIMQTFVEFGVFALAQLALPTGIANGIAVACSGSFNFLMNRNITFKSSSNFWRSVAMFVALYIWNFLFGTWFIGWAAASFGCPEMLGKFITMAMQGIWGFCLCKWVIFR